MTTYTAITDTETGHKKPVTVSLLRRLRDNPLAMFEGASGAPRCALEAFERLTAGTTVRVRQDAVVSENTNGNSMTHSVTFAQKGTIRAQCEVISSSSGTLAVERVGSDGTTTVLQTWAATGAYTARSIDVSVLPGETVTMRVTHTGVAGTTSRRNSRFMTGGANIFPLGISIVGLENSYVS